MRGAKVGVPGCGAGSVALLLINPAAPRIPEVKAASSRCRPPASTPPGTATLVPDLRYQSLQLCPAASVTTWTATRFIDERESINLVRRLNNLPATPPAGPCPDPAAQPWELFLRAGMHHVVVRLEVGRCDPVSRAGAVRYGATALHRDLTALIGDGGA